MSRKTGFSAMVLVLLVLLMTFVGGGAASAKGGRRMTVVVESATITLNVLPAPSATYFITIGDVTEVDGEPATGKFYCKGVFVDPGALGLPPLTDGTPAADGITFVTQRFLIDDVGSIIGTGNEFSEEPLALTGGTGHFTGVHGTYSGDGLPIPVGDGVLTFEFRIRRGRGRR